MEDVQDEVIEPAPAKKKPAPVKDKLSQPIIEPGGLVADRLATLLKRRRFFDSDGLMIGLGKYLNGSGYDIGDFKLTSIAFGEAIADFAGVDLTDLQDATKAQQAWIALTERLER